MDIRFFFLTDGEAAEGVKLTTSAKIRIHRPSSYMPSCHAQEFYLPVQENKQILIAAIPRCFYLFI